MREKLGGIQSVKDNHLMVKPSALSFLRIAILGLFAAFVGLMASGSLLDSNALCIAALAALTAMAGLITCYIVESEIQNAQPNNQS